MMNENNNDDLNKTQEKNNYEVDQSINSNPLGKLPGILFGTWFVSSIIALLFLAEVNGYYTVMVFGQLFFGLGLLFLITLKKDGLIGIPFTLIGLACIIIPFLIMHPELVSSKFDSDKLIVSLAILGFAIVGLLLLIIPFLKRKKLKELCTVTISARVVENLTDHHEGKTLYCPVYGFDFGGKSYRVSPDTYSNVGVKKVDTLVDIKINPNNPEQFLSNEASSIIPLIIGSAFLLISIPLFIFVMMKGVG